MDESDSFRAGMAFQGRLESLRHELDRLSLFHDGRGQGVLYGVAIEMISVMQEGLIPVPVTKRLIDQFDHAVAVWGEDWDRRHARLESDYAEAIRRHDQAIKVACPYCGAPPGQGCVTAGRSGRGHPKGVHDHRDRYREALRIFGRPS